MTKKKMSRRLFLGASGGVVGASVIGLSPVLAQSERSSREARRIATEAWLLKTENCSLPATVRRQLASSLDG